MRGSQKIPLNCLTWAVWCTMSLYFLDRVQILQRLCDALWRKWLCSLLYTKCKSAGELEPLKWLFSACPVLIYVHWNVHWLRQIGLCFDRMMERSCDALSPTFLSFHILLLLFLLSHFSPFLLVIFKCRTVTTPFPVVPRLHWSVCHFCLWWTLQVLFLSCIYFS
jgi:hypothetical protein